MIKIMALYSSEEVCIGCKFSRWHHCEYCSTKTKRFCHCWLGSEHEIDHVLGKCPDYEEMSLEEALND